MNKNPWSREALEQYIGQEESYQLEFKSSRPLLEESINKIDGFFDDLSADVSAFLNSDGGVIICGIEEYQSRSIKHAGLSEKFSKGVPRSRFNSTKVSNKICDRIHPASGALIQVYSVVIDNYANEDLLCFVIEVRSGITAYQAADKRYYSRRSAGIEPMEDKDIRLRMLTDRMARVNVNLTPDIAAMRRQLARFGGPLISGNIPFNIEVLNSGLKTIRFMEIKLSLEPRTAYLVERFAKLGFGDHTINTRRVSWPSGDAIGTVLHPDDNALISAGTITIEREWDDTQLSLIAGVSCYLEDAPSVVAEIDLADHLRAARLALEEASAEGTRRLVKEIGEAIRRHPDDN